jgi:serine protease
MRPLSVASFLSLTAVLCAQAPEAARARRAVLPKHLVDALPVAPGQTRVVVKLAEHRAGLVADGRLVAPEVRAVVGARQVQSFFAGHEDRLRELRARQLAAAPRGELPAVDLALYFEVLAADAGDTAALVRALNALPEVELAYARELPTPPPGDIPPNTPDLSSNQGYRAPAPTGFDGDLLLATTGASGRGVRVLDIEWGWHFDHEDLSGLRPSALVGPPIANATYNSHGTAVFGELLADADQYGVTGLCPDAQAFAATDYPASGYSVANAIVVGLPSLRAGDVMLLEAQTNTPLGLGPTEWIQADFDAILIATNLGIVTVEAAGNGGVNLDSASLGGAFDLGVRDSGAIIVGATTGAALTRAGFSSYGSRISANGWGGGVASTGYGNLWSVSGDVRQYYTASFSGTSSASPMVTSAVLALRGAALAQLDPAQAAALDGFAIRTLLGQHGAPVAGINRRPDMAALLTAAGVLRGLRVIGEPRIGQTCQIALTPAFAGTTGDFYGLIGGLVPTNIELPSVFPAGSGRQLVDPAWAVPLAIGTLGTVPATFPVSVPASSAMQGVSYYVQGVTLQGANNALAATNSVRVHVAR